MAAEKAPENPLASVTDSKKAPADLLEKLRKEPIEKLEAMCNELQEQRNKLKQGQLVLQHVIGERVADESAKRKIATYSDEEKLALYQELKAQGIGSEEKVGGIGGTKRNLGN